MVLTLKHMARKNFKSMKTHYLKIIDLRIMDGFMVKNNGNTMEQPLLPFQSIPKQKSSAISYVLERK